MAIPFDSMLGRQPSANQSPAREMGKDPSAGYAESLYGYAAGRLDAQPLQAWIAWRLIVDAQLDHDTAVCVARDAIAREHAHERLQKPLPEHGHGHRTFRHVGLLVAHPHL